MNDIFTVVIPAYNAENTISRCLQSVLSQTYSPYEVIVVDDNSRDETRREVFLLESNFKAHGIILRYIYLDKNTGPSEARNIGMRYSKGDYIAFLDADDIWIKNKLSVVSKFSCNNDFGIIFHGYGQIDDYINNLEVEYNLKLESIFHFILRNRAQTSCVVLNKKYIQYFDSSMRHSEDYDLWMRILENVNALELIGPPLTLLGRPQLSKGGLSGDTVAMRIGEIRVYLKYISRRWWPRFFLLPVLIIFSMLKHILALLSREIKLLINRIL